jgi:alpha-beta hydrolase superfamily lysophospholipase
MGLCGSGGIGQYAATAPTERHQAIYDRLYIPDGTARPALWFHSAGAGAVGTAALEPWLPGNNCLPILQALASLGLPVLSADTSGSGHWGNDTAQARANDMRTYVGSSAASAAAFKASAALKAILIGVSLGGLLALNFARAFPTLVQAILLFYPAVNLQAIHDGTGGATATAAGTEAAYGGSLASFNAAVVAHDPAQHATDYQQFPISMWRSDVDTVVGSQNQANFAAAVGGSSFTDHVLPGAGHADMAQISRAEVAAFVGRYA